MDDYSSGEEEEENEENEENEEREILSRDPSLHPTPPTTTFIVDQSLALSQRLLYFLRFK